MNLPGCEVLNQDPNELKINQGPTLNKQMFSVNSLMRDLSGENLETANYEDTMLTSLCRDIFGGNSVGVGLFCLKYEDAIGSQHTLRAMRRC